MLGEPISLHRHRVVGFALGQSDPFLTPVTDPTAVRSFQTQIVDVLARGGFLTDLTRSSYGPNDVDGNPSNPKWMAVVGAFQRYANAKLPTIDRYRLPDRFPAQLRTDGVLDNATAELLLVA